MALRTITILILLGGLAWTSFAQSDSPAANRDIELQGTMETEISKILDRFIADKKYYIQISLETSEQAPGPDLPYLPSGKSINDEGVKRLLAAMSSLTSLNIEIFIDKSINDEILTTMKEIIANRLRISDDFKNNISFKKVPINKEEIDDKDEAKDEQEEDPSDEEEDNENEDELLELQAKLLALNNQKDEIERERNDLKGESLQKQTELSQKANELDRVQSELTSLKAQYESLKNKPAASFWQDNAMIIIIVVLLVIILSVWIMVFSKAYDSLSSAMKGIGESLNIFSAREKNDSKSDSAKQLEGAKTSDPAHEAELPPLPPEAAQKALARLYERLIPMLTPETDAIVLNYILKNLKEEGTALKSILAFEFLGKDRFRYYFEKLGIQERKALSFAANNLKIRGSKSQKMMTVAEELVTACFGKDISNVVAKLDSEIEANLLQFSQSEKIDLTINMKTALMPRFFLYLSPLDISQIVKSVSEANKEKLKSITDALAKAPEYRNDSSLDDEIKMQIESYIKSLESTQFSMFYDLYSKVVESLDEKAADAFVEGMSSKSNDLMLFFKKSYISYKSFHLVNDVTMERILDQLEANDIAKIIIASPVELTNAIYRNMNARRTAIVEDELSILKESDQGDDQASLAIEVDKVKAKISRIMKGLLKEGHIVYSSSSESSREVA